PAQTIPNARARASLPNRRRTAMAKLQPKLPKTHTPTKPAKNAASRWRSNVDDLVSSSLAPVIPTVRRLERLPSPPLPLRHRKCSTSFAPSANLSLPFVKDPTASSQPAHATPTASTSSVKPLEFPVHVKDARVKCSSKKRDAGKRSMDAPNI